jgi:hypothetical protein
MVSIDFLVYVWLIKSLELSIGESMNSPQSSDDSPHLKGDSSHSLAGSLHLILPFASSTNPTGSARRWCSRQVKARPELAQTGVYLLLGPRPIGEGDMLYVGEGDPIRPRLESHYA